MLGTRHLPDIPSHGLRAHIAVTPIRSMHVLAPTATVLPVTLMSTLALGNVVMMEGERVSGTGCPRERVKSALSLGAVRQASAASEEGLNAAELTNDVEIGVVGDVSGGGGAGAKRDVNGGGSVMITGIVTASNGGIVLHIGFMVGVGVHTDEEVGEVSTECTAADDMLSQLLRSAGGESVA